MSRHSISQPVSAVISTIFLVTVAGCAGPDRPMAVAAAVEGAPAAHFEGHDPNSAAGDTKGLINGWLDGETVPMRYTRKYFCAEPPTSAVSTGCEIGAAAVVAPRGGPIPNIYALGPVGFQPDPATVHCPGGTVCLNHPHSLDLSRLGLPDSVRAPAHSHIITGRQGGWHNTVNIRVTTLAAWNAIADARTLTKVRELQAAGLVGPDIPTNVYFFFEVHKPSFAGK